MRYILHYTQPGDVVLDTFCGTGMTGVAAQLCADRQAVSSMGYQVDPDGTVLDTVTEGGKKRWQKISALGARRVILNDLSPLGTLVSYNFNAPVDFVALQREIDRISEKLNSTCGWMYQTLHHPSEAQLELAISLIERSDNPNLESAGTVARINYTVWSDVFSCPECASDIVFFDVAMDEQSGGVRDELVCPNCDAQFGKKKLERRWSTKHDPSVDGQLQQAVQVPILINYSVGKSRHEKRPDKADLALLRKILTHKIQENYPAQRMPVGAETRRNDPIGITHTHHFYTNRNLSCLAELRAYCSGSRQFYRQLLFCFTSTHQFVNRLCRLNVSNYFSGKGGES